MTNANGRSTVIAPLRTRTNKARNLRAAVAADPFLDRMRQLAVDDRELFDALASIITCKDRKAAKAMFVLMRRWNERVSELKDAAAQAS